MNAVTLKTIIRGAAAFAPVQRHLLANPNSRLITIAVEEKRRVFEVCTYRVNRPGEKQ